MSRANIVNIYKRLFFLMFLQKFEVYGKVALAGLQVAIKMLLQLCKVHSVLKKAGKVSLKFSTANRGRTYLG